MADAGIARGSCDGDTSIGIVIHEAGGAFFEGGAEAASEVEEDAAAAIDVVTVMELLVDDVTEKAAAEDATEIPEEAVGVNLATASSTNELRCACAGLRVSIGVIGGI